LDRRGKQERSHVVSKNEQERVSSGRKPRRVARSECIAQAGKQQHRKLDASSAAAALFLGADAMVNAAGPRSRAHRGHATSSWSSSMKGVTIILISMLAISRCELACPPRRRLVPGSSPSCAKRYADQRGQTSRRGELKNYGGTRASYTMVPVTAAYAAGARKSLRPPRSLASALSARISPTKRSKSSVLQCP